MGISCNFTVFAAAIIFVGSYMLYIQHSISQKGMKQEDQHVVVTLRTKLKQAKILETMTSEQLHASLTGVEQAYQVKTMAADLQQRRSGKSAASVKLSGLQHSGVFTPWTGKARDLFGSGSVDQETAKRRDAVKAAMAHAWGGYVQYAWGFDELQPKSKRGKNSFGGLGATITDALDTLWIMEMTAEYERARNWIKDELRFDSNHDESVFESTIRVLGGMMSAYDLTGDEMYITRSQELADRLLFAFETQSGIPFNIINLNTLKAHNPSWAKQASTLSEFGTEQMEFVKLSYVTNESIYADKAEHSITLLHEKYPDKGLMPVFINPKNVAITKEQITLGALGDSYYEYLLKTWLLKDKKDEMYRGMWERAMDEMMEKLVQTGSKTGLKYVAEMYRNRLRHKMDHLACFIPAMLGLGVHAGAVTGEKAEVYMMLAKNLTYTCWQMYERQPTGLSAEYYNFMRGNGDMVAGAKHNVQRPEAVEAFFVMWRVTGDPVYKEWGWNVFQAFEKHCKVEAGYAGVKDVRRNPPDHDDTQQSFFLAETLKYLYLLFSPTDTMPLDKWVLNTEAHPLRIIKNWNQPPSTASPPSPPDGNT